MCLDVAAVAAIGMVNAVFVERASIVCCRMVHWTWNGSRINEHDLDWSASLPLAGQEISVAFPL